MKMIKILLAAGIVFASPAIVEASVRTAKDGFATSWNSPKLTDTSNVSIVYVKNEKELRALFEEAGGKIVPQEGTFSASSYTPPQRLYAFSKVNTAKKTCTIYTIDPSVSYQPEFIGHELMHCFHGAWHD